MNGGSKKFFTLFFRGFRYPIESYKKLLEKQPLLVHSTQTGVLYLCSDVIAQTFVEKTSLNNINFKRTLVFATTGAIYTGPVASLWYRILAKKIGTTGPWMAVKKVAADQCLFGPVFHLGLLTVINTLHGRNMAFIKEQISLKYVDILLTSVKIWPFVQFVNFSFTPVNYQILVGQTVSVFWNIYMSWKTQQGVGTSKDQHFDRHSVNVSAIRTVV